MRFKEKFIDEIVGRWDTHCEGYNFLNRGYVCVVSLHINTSEHRFKENKVCARELQEIGGFDLAEASGPYMGQINMIDVTSFSGPNGFIWGYHIARHPAIKGPRTSLGVVRANAEEVPVFSAEPLLEAAYALFGSKDKLRFPIYPGSHVPCVNSYYHSHEDDKFVFGAVAIGIAEDESKNANLFMKFSNGIKKTMPIENARKQILQLISQSVIEIGANQNYKFKEIYAWVEIAAVEPQKYACAFAAIPYILLPRNAIPEGNAKSLLSLTLPEWEKKVGL